MGSIKSFLLNNRSFSVTSLAQHNQHVVANHTDSDRAIYLNNQLPAGTNDIEINSGKRNLNEKLILRNLDPTPAKINNIKVTCYMLHSFSFSKRV